MKNKQKICPNCGRPVFPRLWPGGSPKKYCSNKCRWAAAYKRRKPKPRRVLWYSHGFATGIVLSALVFLGVAGNIKPAPIIQKELVYLESTPIVLKETVIIEPSPTPTYARKISQAGIDFIKQWEALEQAMYTAPEGDCTIGWGHRIHAGACNSDTWPSYISKDQAEALLRQDISTAEFAFYQNVDVNLLQYQYDAMISITFNMGWGNFSKKEFVSLLEEGEFDKVPASIRYYVGDIYGNVLGGLIRRRDAEANLFEFGIY